MTRRLLAARPARPAPLLARRLRREAGARRRRRGGGAAEPLRLMLDYFPNADHAGIYAAQASRRVREGRARRQDHAAARIPSAPLKLLLAGRADLAISYEPELLLARDKGAELVAVGALVQKPLTSLMAVGKARRSARRRTCAASASARRGSRTSRPT